MHLERVMQVKTMLSIRSVLVLDYQVLQLSKKVFSERNLIKEVIKAIIVLIIHFILITLFIIR